ncbi:MAG: winged helix-turn-helix transcriptional regulator [Akkermansia sp.]|nr:winged helix-turn-helix transcriptional regulator [Akkermansia sp.]
MHTTRQAISFLMKLIADRVSTLFSLRAEVPLTAAQSRVVMYLEACGGGPLSQKEIEQYLNVTHTTAKGLLQRLEEKGFVRTAFDSKDGRVKNAYLTEAARKCRDELMGHIRALTDQMMQGISAEEETHLFELLRRVYGNIK